MKVSFTLKAIKVKYKYLTDKFVGFACLHEYCYLLNFQCISVFFYGYNCKILESFEINPFQPSVAFDLHNKSNGWLLYEMQHLAEMYWLDHWYQMQNVLIICYDKYTPECYKIVTN